VEKAQLLDYEVVLIFFCLRSPEMAKERVALRVRLGGHNIPPQLIALGELNTSNKISNLVLWKN
jgi:predicted ABC-type ATPase